MKESRVHLYRYRWVESQLASDASEEFLWWVSMGNLLYLEINCVSSL
jgi:hypothetical protein